MRTGVNIKQVDGLDEEKEIEKLKADDAVIEEGHAATSTSDQTNLRRTLMRATDSSVIDECFELIRDAGSDENARAIQDSETEIALTQKRLIHGLVKKGWKKNEIVFEM